MKLETHLRDRSPLQLPKIAKGDSLFNYCVNPHRQNTFLLSLFLQRRKILMAKIKNLLCNFFLHSGKWSHWNEHLSDYVVPDINPISYGR